MRQINLDPGCVYDTLAFLARRLQEEIETEKAEEPADDFYYKKIKERLFQAGNPISYYLLPFAYRHREQRPFLHLLLLDEQPYGKCSYEQTMNIFSNSQYLRRRFIEYFFNPSDQNAILRNMEEHPAGIDTIKRQGFEPPFETYIYYALIRFAEVIKSLQAAFQIIYTAIKNEQNRFLEQNQQFIQKLEPDSVNIEKLKALAGIKHEPFQFSLSLLDAHKISFRDNERGHFLIGYNYEDVLETRHKYINATPYDFAIAIGNPVRYEIYQALAQGVTMTRADMEKKLHMSRAALDHNLKTMRDRGLLIIDRQIGQTNYYRLDYGYIRAAIGFILDGM